jgi:hypothetical protein
MRSGFPHLLQGKTAQRLRIEVAGELASVVDLQKRKRILDCSKTHGFFGSPPRESKSAPTDYEPAKKSKLYAGSGSISAPQSY